jgi:dipeptidase E
MSQQRLFLTSSIGVAGVGESIRCRLGHDRPLKTAFLITPVEGDSDQADLAWVQKDRDGLNNNGFITFDYTITNKTSDQIRQELKDIEVLYVSGGNEFYLKEKGNDNNFAEYVKELVSTGVIYMGTSAGSIIAGTSMAELQNPKDLSTLKYPVDTVGYSLVPYTIIPHWGSAEFRNRWLSEETFNYMFSGSTPLITPNNYQYIEVIGDDSRIIDVRNES